LERGIISALIVMIILSSSMIPLVLSQSSDPAGPTRERYRPVIGGIQIEMRVSGYSLGYCTASYVAQDSRGTRYLVTASHCLTFLGREVSAAIYQPDYSTENYIGTASLIYSDIDTAFIPLTVSSDPSVLRVWYYYGYFGVPQRVVGYCNDAELSNLIGKQVVKTGRSTGTTIGTVNDYRPMCLYVDSKIVCGYIVNATIQTATDDSGAPYFFSIRCYGYYQCDVILVSHHMSKDEKSDYRYSMAVWYVVDQTGISPVLGG